MELSEAKHDVFQAIADPTRRKLLGMLAEQEMPVTGLSSHFPMSRTAVSKHLRILSNAGLVKEHKVGRERRYRLNPDPLLELKRWLSYYDRFWDNRLQVLKQLVESPDEGSQAAIPDGLRAVLNSESDKQNPSG